MMVSASKERLSESGLPMILAGWGDAAAGCRHEHASGLEELSCVGGHGDGAGRLRSQLSFRGEERKAQANERLQHVVLFWLKEPGNGEHRRQIIEASESFREIPGVRALRVGEAIPSDRGIVDDSYDVGLLVTVDDRQALQAYLDHPIHVAARDRLLPPLVERAVVYDFQQRRSPGR